MTIQKFLYPEPTYIVPIFDTHGYQVISSRIGRLRKDLLSRTPGTKRYERQAEALVRAEKNKKKLINVYLSELAIYCAVTGADAVLTTMIEKDIVPKDDTALIGMIKEHCVKLHDKYARALRIYKPGDHV